jgi:lipopolysaccharide transport system ATP-binding protein
MDEVIELAGLGSFIDQPIKTYSSGMKARLSFAIAYSANPDIILIDEVLSVGDAAFKDKSKKLMLEKINGGQTVVIVSHNVSLLEQVCDRIVVLTGKSIINGLTKKEALERYKRL